jgi:hypothetical protein
MRNARRDGVRRYKERASARRSDRVPQTGNPVAGIGRGGNSCHLLLHRDIHTCPTTTFWFTFFRACGTAIDLFMKGSKMNSAKKYLAAFGFAQSWHRNTNSISVGR